MLYSVLATNAKLMQKTTIEARITDNSKKLILMGIILITLE